MISAENIVAAAVQYDHTVLNKVVSDLSEFYGVPGKEHYRLLSYLANMNSNTTIIDIGTHHGASAFALSVNKTNTVHSFDIIKKSERPEISNVNFHLADLWNTVERKKWAATLLSSSLIVLDIDPHSGVPEYEFYEWLKANKYQGLLFCDDIVFFKDMRDNFWFKIPTEEKMDITAIGHWSGSGIISFRPRPDLVWETYSGTRSIGVQSAPSPWTVVTADFDLPLMPFASASTKERDKKHYLRNALTTMSLDQNLAVFCEKDSLEELTAMRPPWLLEKTKFYVVDFEELPMTKYRQKIIDDRIKRSYNPDPRNTASYYLMCMARYAALKRTMEENPFGSTHFAWLNICIERMGYKNIAHLDDVFYGEPRDGVSATYIDYLSRDSYKDLNHYFQWGRCSLCSGFFTGCRDKFTQFCNRIEEQFLEFLEAGYGHADEQLFSPTYFKYPELFDLYVGDYQQMVMNYRYVYENPNITLSLVIPKSAAAQDWYTCFNACKFLMNSFKLKKVALSIGQEEFLKEHYERAHKMMSTSSWPLISERAS